MNYTRGLILSAMIALVSAPVISNNIITLCEGFLPKNDMYIGVNDPAGGGMTYAEYTAVLDQFETYYRPLVSARGATLKVNRLWDNGEVNASATRSFDERTWELNMYGGLARHPAMDKDGYMLVACHEMGHQIGGAPKVPGLFGIFNAWASNEGQSDYFASLRCLRVMFKEADNAAFVATQPINPTVRTKCEMTYDTQAEENLCMRIGMAGNVTAMVFKDLKKLNVAPSFDTPDTTSVAKTSDDHPEPQCRLDTYFQGGLCRHDMNIALSEKDPRIGTCLDNANGNLGARPHCWFKP